MAVPAKGTLCLVLLLALSACRSADNALPEQGNASVPLSAVPSEESTLPAVETAASTHTPKAPTDEDPTAILPPPIQEPILAGLIYTLNDRLWQVLASGESALMAACGGMALSPDGTQLLAVIDDDIWVRSVRACQDRNLTNTAEVVEGAVQWWPAEADLVVFGQFPDFWSEGSLASVRTDGEGYALLDPVPANTLPALSPAGGTIAYETIEGPWLYQLPDKRESFDLDRYEPGTAQIDRMGSPSWSPDGARLAWIVRVENADGQRQIAVAVFDLLGNQVQLLHPYSPVGREGWPLAAAWSPDGKWIAVNAWAEDPSEAGLWVLSLATGDEYHLDQPDMLVDQGSAPIWHPNSTGVLFSATGAQAFQPTYWYAEVGSWVAQTVQLSAEADVLAWRLP